LLMAFGLCAVVAAAIIALWTYGYFGLRYILTPAALLIRWLGEDEAVPLADLQGVYSGQRLGKLPRLRGFTWHGYWVGRALHRDTAGRCRQADRGGGGRGAIGGVCGAGRQAASGGRYVDTRRAGLGARCDVVWGRGAPQEAVARWGNAPPHNPVD